MTLPEKIANSYHHSCYSNTYHSNGWALLITRHCCLRCRSFISRLTFLWATGLGTYFILSTASVLWAWSGMRRCFSWLGKRCKGTLSAWFSRSAWCSSSLGGPLLCLFLESLGKSLLLFFLCFLSSSLSSCSVDILSDLPFSFDFLIAASFLSFFLLFGLLQSSLLRLLFFFGLLQSSLLRFFFLDSLGSSFFFFLDSLPLSFLFLPLNLCLCCSLHLLGDQCNSSLLLCSCLGLSLFSCPLDLGQESKLLWSSVFDFF